MINQPSPSSSQEDSAPPLPSKTNKLVPLHSKLTKEEKEEYLRTLKKMPLFTQIMRYVALISLIFTLVWWWWLHMDLDESNTYLSSYGVSQNLQQNYQRMREEKTSLTDSITLKQSKIEKIQKQIEERQYSIYTDRIKELQSQQLTLFDTSDTLGRMLDLMQALDADDLDSLLDFENIQLSQTDTKELERFLSQDQKSEEDLEKILQELGFTKRQYGLLQAPFHVQEYLTARNFDDDILLTAHNELTVENIVLNRDIITFSVSGGNTVDGTTFYLLTKFVDVLNSFPFFENGEIDSFQKQKNNENNYIMQTTLRFDVNPQGLDYDKENPLFTDFQLWDKRSSLSSDRTLFSKNSPFREN